MKLEGMDRRILNRRIRNRLSPMIREKLKKAPLMLVITTTIWFSSAAVAQQAAALGAFQLEAQSVSLAQDDTVKTYTKEELKEKMPASVRDLDTKISEQIVSVLQTMGKGKPGEGFVKAGTSEQISSRDYLLSQAALAQKDATEANSKGLETHFKEESSKAIVDDVASNTVFYQKLKRGFDFKLNLANIFSTKSSEEAKTHSGNVRYGLILKDIVPENDPRKYRAAVNDTPEDALKYAGRAEVVWTIGPVSEQEFSNTETTSSSPQEDVVKRLDSSKTDDEFWSNGVPEIGTGFDFNAKPTSESLGEFVNNKGKLPPLKITVTQEQGLYEIMAETQNEKNGKQNVEHQFKVPVVGTLSFGRRYDEKMEAIRTSANNILIDKRAPLVSVHYLDKAKQYVLDGEVLTTQNYKLNFKASSKAAHADFADKNRADEKYELEVKRDF